MHLKISLLCLVLLIFLCVCDGATIKKQGKARKLKKCFSPKKPPGMPDEVFAKYKSSTKYLSQAEQEDFWGKFKAWWENILRKHFFHVSICSWYRIFPLLLSTEQIKEFLQKLGEAIKNIFAGKKNNDQPKTEPPPTPPSEKEGTTGKQGGADEGATEEPCEPEDESEGATGATDPDSESVQTTARGEKEVEATKAAGTTQSPPPVKSGDDNQEVTKGPPEENDPTVVKAQLKNKKKNKKQKKQKKNKDKKEEWAEKY